MRLFKKILKIGGIVVLVLLVISIAAGFYFFNRLQNFVYVENEGDSPSVLQYFDEPAPDPAPQGVELDLSDALFDPARFQEPELRFGPWTRWWWPGNDVEPDELRREIRLLAESGFGGVEIQPFTSGVDVTSDDDATARVYSYDTESYFENLRVVMEAAREAGIGVDISAGGGWPSGGPQITPEDNFRTLAWSEASVRGGREVSVELPRPSASLTYYAMGALGYLLGGRVMSFYQNEAELVEVIGARVLEDGRSSLPWRFDDQVALDWGSVELLRNQVDEEGHLNWNAPEGTWRIVAIWSMPDGEAPTLIPSRETGLVVDHFDRRRVEANYNYLFGERSGLAEYYGNPFRAIFNDSYEFKVERHFTANFLEEFERRRGYDLRPWLPAMMRAGNDNFLFSYIVGGALPDFRYSDDDERVDYDYALTVSDLFIENFLDGSDEWMAARGLQNRTQAYGMKFDVLRGLGHAQIPETEQLYSGGSEMFLRFVSSGAELYNRPVVTSESVVFMGRDYMTTPQKTKIAMDKLFSSGVNQAIYHGTPYKYEKPVYGEDGWHPFSNEVLSMAAFSTNASETDAYWKYQGDINRYIARSQYMMRLGKPSADVLIYYPFLGFHFERPGHEELLYSGALPGPEPTVATSMFSAGSGPPTEQAIWIEATWELIRELDNLGISWTWVNDESLQAATWNGDAINIRGNTYRGVILPNEPWIQTASAENLAVLTEQGANVIVLGDPPARQPGYLNYEEYDQLVQERMESVLAAETGVRLTGLEELASLRIALAKSLYYGDRNSGLRHFERRLADGSLVVFVWNTVAESTSFRLAAPEGLANGYWLDPTDGAIAPVRRDETGNILGFLGSYGSAILYAGSRPVPDSMLSKPKNEWQIINESEPLLSLEEWDLAAGDVTRDSTALFDWRDDEALRYSSELGVYTTNFTLDELEADARYFLDLGNVYFTADIRVNGNEAGTLLFEPYRLDVTDYLVAGENQLEVTVTPTQRNGYIGRALAGDEAYARFKNQAETIMAAGLAGPVRLLVLETGE